MVSAYAAVVLWAALVDGLSNLRNIGQVVGSGRGRQLLPGPPSPHPPQHKASKNGCLGMTKEEREQAWIFQGEMPPCDIVVGGTLVAGGDDSSNGVNVNSSGSESGSGSSGYNGGSASSGSSSNGSGSNSNSNTSSSGGSSSSSSGGSSSNGSSGNSNSDSSSNGSSGNSNSDSSNYNSDESQSGNTGNEDTNGESSSSSGNGSNNYNGNEDSSGSGNEGYYTDSSASGQNDGQTYYETNENNGEDSYVDAGDDVNPLRYFNISDCGTYTNIWLWELALTCESSTSLASCECTSASVLKQYGDFECSETCPDDCPVCHSCKQIVGCSSDDLDEADGERIPRVLGGEQSTTRAVAMGIAAAAVTSIVLGVSMYLYKKRSASSENAVLGTNLIPDTPPPLNIL